MSITLRQRIVLTLLPLLILMIGLGGVAAALLYHLGGRIEAILHENYDSVLYMERLNESIERIDSSFQFALLGQEDKGRAEFAEHSAAFEGWVSRESHNITEPGEQALVERLNQLAQHYGEQGRQFYRRPPGDPKRHSDYFAPGGLLATLRDIKSVANEILLLNQKSMEDASGEARRTARTSLIGFALALALSALLAAWLAFRTARTILRPIQTLTDSALGIGAGNLDQIVPVHSRDELGRLAEAFNAMARQLRHYRNTDYAKLLRAQRTSQATIDSFPDPVLVVDAEGQVTMANPAARRLLGVVARKSNGDGAVAWIPPEDLRQPLTEALRDQRAFLPEGFDRNLALQCEGQEHSLLPRILPIRDPYGNTLGAALLLQDVTRFRLLNEVKSNLLSTVSHELKTPLTGVRLALHLLLEEAVGPLTAKQTELLLDARENAERLLSRVNHLLDLARLEQKQVALDLRPEDAATLLQTAADAVRPRALDKGLTLVVEVAPNLPPVAADAVRLGHAFDNLLDNAVTYTERGGKITLAASQGPSGVIFLVSDTGKGIPAEYLPRIFERFFQVPGQSEPGGTGLGLAIVREIITAHDGTIDCTSTPGVGTTFRITLPLWDDGVSGSRASAAWAPEDGHVQ